MKLVWPAREHLASYVDALCKQIEYYGPVISSLGYQATNLYWGGGTPTRLTPEQITRVHQTLARVVDLSHVAELLVEEFEARAQGSDHRLEPEIDGVATGLGDEPRILQVGRALVENALRHTPGGTHVRVRTGRDGERVFLVVEDDGPGIGPEEAVQVFERFYRGDGTGRASGSGLGLAIARELAEAMQGEIDLASEPGRTTFTLLLPAASSTSSSPVE